MSKPRSGFVAIIGRPNVGKSTLLNRLVGEKLAGISPKPQTTRHAIRGILNRPEGQLVFLDTPGMHEAKDMLGTWMTKEINEAFESADLIYWIVLPGRIHPYDDKILQAVKKSSTPAILLVNKIDLFKKTEVLPVLEHYSRVHSFVDYVPVSAKEGVQIDVLLDATFRVMPEAPAFFPDDQISDQNERFLAAELIREKVFRKTSEEIPYATAVVIEEFEERSENLSVIKATIVVEKDSQRRIIIGHKGEMLKHIGTEARLDLESLFQRKIFLELWVKTLPNWKRDRQKMRELGYQ